MCLFINIVIHWKYLNTQGELYVKHVCTTILPTAAWLSVDWQTGFHDANANGCPHSGTPILFFIVGFPLKIGLLQTVFIFRGNPNYFTLISSRIEYNAFNTLHGIQCIEYHVLYTMFDYYHVNCDLRPLNCNPETNKLTFDFP